MSSTKIKSKPILNYAAGAAFLLLGVIFLYCFLYLAQTHDLSVLDSLSWKIKILVSPCSINFPSDVCSYIYFLPLAIGSILVSISLFSSKCVFLTIGAALSGISLLSAFFLLLFRCLSGRITFYNGASLYSVYIKNYAIPHFLFTCCWFMLTISKPPKTSTILSFISAALWVMGLALVFSYHKYDRLSFIVPLLLMLLYPVGAVLYAFKTTPNPLKKPVTSSNAATGTKIESLSKLSDLLDKGIISQEEFEAKKQNILNS